jgi:hypothetical protein
VAGLNKIPAVNNSLALEEDIQLLDKGLYDENDGVSKPDNQNMFPDMSAIEDEFSGEKHRLIISMTSDVAELPRAMQ